MICVSFTPSNIPICSSDVFYRFYPSHFIAVACQESGATKLLEKIIDVR